MVINDKALVREMKRAYKGGGYTVAVRNGSCALVIYSFAWVVELSGDNIPREVLSLLTLHMGFLPEEGYAYKILKGKDEPTVQSTMYDVAMKPLHMREETVAELTAVRSGVPLLRIRKTPLIFDGWNLWQKMANNGIVMLDPGYEDLLLKLEDVMMAGDAVYKEGKISKVFIMKGTNDGNENVMSHLGKISWVAK